MYALASLGAPPLCVAGVGQCALPRGLGLRRFCVASMDDWSLLKVLGNNNAAVVQLEAVVPQGTSWRDFHAFVGRYHKSQFETAVGDLGMLRAAWESAAEVSLPYAAWLCIAEVQLEETFWTL